MTNELKELKVIKDPKSISLKVHSTPVTEFNDALKHFVNDLCIAMIKENGIGISAIQVGVPLRVFLVMGRNGHDVLVVINPEIIEKEKITTSFGEGCLSVPGIRKDVKRYKRIKVKFQDLNGDFHTRKLSKRESFIFQHEYDHLRGVLFTER